MSAPCLGFTPHYEDTGNLETQSKVYAAYNKIDMSSSYNKNNLKKKATVVEL